MVHPMMEPLSFPHNLARKRMEIISMKTDFEIETERAQAPRIAAEKLAHFRILFGQWRDAFQLLHDAKNHLADLNKISQFHCNNCRQAHEVSLRDAERDVQNLQAEFNLECEKLAFLEV